MPFALILIGLLLFVAAYHNNVAALGAQVKADFVGSSGFMIWVVAIFILGAIGYIKVFQGVSRAFLVLIVIVILLSNKGVFSTLVETLGVSSENQKSDATTPATPATTPTAPMEGQ